MTVPSEWKPPFSEGVREPPLPETAARGRERVFLDGTEGKGESEAVVELIERDDSFLVCVKPAGVLSTDEPGGLPELARRELGDPTADVRTVHRLDRVVGGLMVLARSAESASRLSAQVRDGTFEKEYLAVIHWRPHSASGVFTDFLVRDPGERKTYVTGRPGRGVREARLEYETLASRRGMSLMRIHLITGRTHQIRAQFSARGLPLVGDRKYSRLPDGCPIALWSYRIGFCHPVTGERLSFVRKPPGIYPWTVFAT